SNAVLHVPLLAEGAAKRGDEAAVGEAVRGFVVANREALGIDVAQLGTSRVARITEELWQGSIPPVVNGIPVRGGRVLATIGHGNLVLLGTETWGNVAIDTKPTISADEAVADGFGYVGGKGSSDVLWKRPMLEIVPFAPDGFDPSRLATAA